MDVLDMSAFRMGSFDAVVDKGFFSPHFDDGSIVTDLTSSHRYFCVFFIWSGTLDALLVSVFHSNKEIVAES